MWFRGLYALEAQNSQTLSQIPLWILQTSILDFGVKKWQNVRKCPPHSELAASSFHPLMIRDAPSGTRISPSALLPNAALPHSASWAPKVPKPKIFGVKRCQTDILDSLLCLIVMRIAPSQTRNVLSTHTHKLYWFPIKAGILLRG